MKASIPAVEALPIRSQMTFGGAPFTWDSAVRRAGWHQGIVLDTVGEALLFAPAAVKATMLK